MSRRSADCRGVEGLPLLVVSYYSGDTGTAASNHIDDRLAALIRKGIKPVVLCSPCRTASGRPGLHDIKRYRVPSPAPSGIVYEVRRCLEQRKAYLP